MRALPGGARAAMRAAAAVSAARPHSQRPGELRDACVIFALLQGFMWH
jgi:hypothetical protein